MENVRLPSSSISVSACPSYTTSYMEQRGIDDNAFLFLDAPLFQIFASLLISFHANEGHNKA